MTLNLGQSKTGVARAGEDRKRIQESGQRKPSIVRNGKSRFLLCIHRFLHFVFDQPPQFLILFFLKSSEDIEPRVCLEPYVCGTLGN